MLNLKEGIRTGMVSSATTPLLESFLPGTDLKVPSYALQNKSACPYRSFSVKTSRLSNLSNSGDRILNEVENTIRSHYLALCSSFENVGM